MHALPLPHGSGNDLALPRRPGKTGGGRTARGCSTPARSSSIRRSWRWCSKDGEHAL